MKICVVDDLLSMRKALRRVLQSLEGVEIVDFADAPEAVRYLETNYVDIVIADIYLQKGSGFDVLRHVRERAVCSDTPVIFVTGEGTKDDIVHSSEFGVSDYVLKPFEADELLSKVVKNVEKYRKPSRRDQLMREADQLVFEGELEQAREHYIRTQHNDQLSARAHVGVARIDFLMGDRTAALKRLRKTVVDHKLFFPAHALLVEIYLAMGKPRLAIESLVQELEVNGKQPHRRMLLADLYLDQGKDEEALAQMRVAIVDSPKDGSLLIKMAQILTSLGNHEKALHYYLKTRRLAKNSREALQGIVEVCVSIGDTQRAHQLLTDQLKTDKSRVEVYLYRAKLHEMCKEYEPALQAIEAYLLAADDDRDALRYKAKLYGKLGRHTEQAESLAELATYGSSPELEGKVGLAYIKAGKYPEAIRHYTRAVKLNPDNPKYRFNLAFALEQCGQFEKALSMLQTVLQLSPGHDEARDFVKRLRAKMTSPGKNRAS